MRTAINNYENLGTEKIFERRLGDDVKDVVDDEIVAVQSQIKSVDEEYIQVRMHRDGLMNRANFPGVGKEAITERHGKKKGEGRILEQLRS